MNYEAAAKLANGGLMADGRAIPVGRNWSLVNFALAGYGFLATGTLTDADPVACSTSVARTCTATSSIEVA